MNNYNLYYIFYCVASEGNMTLAAKKMYLTQPAVSKSITKLEEELHTLLFIRGSKGIHLTPQGELLYRQLKPGFEAIHKGEKLLKQYTESGSGHIIIGVSSTLCKYVLLPYLNLFRKQYPNITFSIKCQPTLQTIADIESEKIDIGIIGESEHTFKYELKRILQIQDVFVSSSDYLDGYLLKHTLSYNDLAANATFLLLDQSNLSRQYMNRYFDTENLSSDHLIEATSMDLLIDLAKTGLGVACVIRNFIEKELETGELVEINCNLTLPKRYIGFAYPKTAKESSALCAFISFLCNHT